ncbi:carboxymuconolactone decarboxylase family protein [Nocardia transvalensis]|uniref:carboxymuconolactone decarboxylase family protein n=1 Tax=Nocardia transvalensis TaxID=37333 RepID=UPI001893C91F|nr:carboxymuconolactone decarboxylase family protein [Nocardia transvalensis]MBF6334126.1 carboxymuconolactone decarboxylase family protein [Nocardia transvalensis]
MAGITLPDDSCLDDVLSRVPAAIRPAMSINLVRALSRSPELAIEFTRVGSVLFAAGALSPVDRELVILACGACYEAPYETAQHEPISRSVGVSEAQQAAAAARRWDDPAFSVAQQALLRFAAAVAAAPTVPADVFDEVSRHYDDRQVVEAVFVTGYYFLVARLTTVLDVPLDPPADDRVLQAMLNAHNSGH